MQCTENSGAFPGELNQWLTIVCCKEDWVYLLHLSLDLIIIILCSGLVDVLFVNSLHSHCHVRQNLFGIIRLWPRKVDTDTRMPVSFKLIHLSIRQAKAQRILTHIGQGFKSLRLGRVEGGGGFIRQLEITMMHFKLFPLNICEHCWHLSLYMFVCLVQLEVYINYPSFPLKYSVRWKRKK